MTKLPIILDQIAAVAGKDAALTIMRLKGGMRSYIPKPEHLHAGHWLVEALGFEKASLVAAALGGEAIDVPLGSTGARALQHAAIKEALARGDRVLRIAREVGVHRSTVMRQKKKLSEQPLSKA